MSRWSDAVDVELNEVYAQIPDIGCRGLCADACGPIDMGPGERARMRRAGVKIPTRAQAVQEVIDSDGKWSCPALTADDRCSARDVRPAICRIWGATEDLPCPYGCRPANGRLLTGAESYALLDAANKAGTSEEPWTAADFDRALADPRGREARRALVQHPVRTRRIPRT